MFHAPSPAAVAFKPFIPFVPHAKGEEFFAPFLIGPQSQIVIFPFNSFLLLLN